jgi:putative tryptophan/tyrosine transport system substrate-binding protein
MRRRDFITLLGGAAAGWPLAVRAQQPAKAHRVGFVLSTSPVSELAGPDPINPAVRSFVHALRDLGYVEGQNLVLERRPAEGRFERFPEIIGELVSINVDVIVTVTTAMARAAKQVTQTVPIVMLAGNPVEEGLVQSLARPGGNITGLTGMTGLENNTKRVQLLKEILPAMSRVAFLQSNAEMLDDAHEKMVEVVTRDLGVELLFAEHTPSDYAGAFAFIARERPDALVVAASAVNYANRRLIAEFAAKNRLPAVYADREYAAVGGLFAYGADTADLFRRLAGYVDRILKGAKPADLPVEQPTKFELVINLKTAKALGLTVPPALLAGTNEVIE